MRKKMLIVLLIVALTVGTASAQLGSGIVYDPTNYQNALLRYFQLQQHLVELQKSYAQLVSQYNLALQMARNIQNMQARYRALFSQWRNGSALNTFGNTAGWITGVNTGNVGGGYQLATTQLFPYNPQQLSGMDPMELSRVRSQYASVELADGANQTAMVTIGAIRTNAQNVQTQMGNLENDSFSEDSELNTEVSVLNKINAANVLTLQSVQDSNKLLASLLEQQLVASKQQREMTANSIDTDITRQATVAGNMNQLTGTLTNSLQNFRMP
ncbi:MAG: hypothetical protein WAK48_27220 [Candidatus Acidiferrum sp.]|jgi:hypothetical protein